MAQVQARRRYTIAWICPLVVDYNAAVRMLDEKHSSPPNLSTGSNAYTLGSIHGHNVVVLMLSETGSVPAADAVARMQKTFPELEHGLLVGIGGGVPVKTDSGDIRLGDVVVGTPASVHPGTVRWDQGKAETHGVTRTGCLSRPPAPFLIAAKKLEATRSAQDDPIYRNFKKFELNRLAQEQLYPGRNDDRLYEPNYNHLEPGMSCMECGCDPKRLVHRDQRDDRTQSPYIVVHNGTVATGEVIMKDAAARDKLAQDFGAICFETEAAGVLYNFPCLVIRGIANYCDSHKDRKWHKYAAVTAAAYARAVLEHVPYQGVKRSSDDEVIERNQRRLIANWMSPAISEHQQQYLRDVHMPGTGDWLLKDDNFREWLDGRKKTLLLSGESGVGKTVMVSSVIQHLQMTFSAEPLVATSYVYCDSRQAEKGILKLLLNLSRQLYTQLDFSPESIIELHRLCVEQQKSPEYGQIFRALTFLCNQYERVFIIVDALDELFDAATTEKFLATLADLQANANVNILLTWQEIPDIELGFDSISRIEIRASKTDLEEYVGRRIDQVPFLAGDTPAQQQVKESLLRMLGRTPRFLLAHLFMALLQDCSSTTEAVDILQEITEDLDEYRGIYRRIMARIEKQVGDKRHTSICVLAWLWCAMRPLTLPELQCAVTLQARRTGIDIPGILNSAFISSACVGLVTVNSVNDTVQLVHASAHDYLRLHQVQTEWESEAHSEITQTCLDYLSTDMMGTSDLSPDPFHAYAAQNWGHHAQMSSPSLTSRLIEFTADEKLAAKVSRHTLGFEVSHESPRVQETGMTNMHLAAYYGLHDTLNAMIEAKESLPWYHWQRIMNRIFRGPLGLDSKDSSGRSLLSYAAEKGSPQIVKLLLQKGATADLRDATGRTPFSWAAGSKNLATLSELLSSVEIDAEDNTGRTPLSWAAGNGHLQAVDWLLAEKLIQGRTADRSLSVWQGLAAGFKNFWTKPSLSEDEPSGGTPLIWASSNGHLRVVTCLLENNAPLEEQDLNGRTAISWAAGNGHAVIVQVLLHQGCDPNSTDKMKRDALMWAAAHGHLAAASNLLRGEACSKVKDSAGRTALSLAAENGQNALVAFLLEKGAPSDDQDNQGRTPLSWAAAGGHKATIMMLLDHHALLNHRDNNGRTSLSWAAGGGQVKIVEFLLRMGANIEIADQSGRNALSWAAGNGKMDMVLFFLDIGHSSLLTATDTLGLTFFSWAARNGHDKIIRLLVSRLDSDLIHIRTKKGETALFVACQYGRLEVVKVFLEKEVFSKYDTNNSGLTALMVAASEDQSEIAELLLKNGAPINAMDPKMRTVLHHAAHRGSYQFVNLSLKYGAGLEIQDHLGRTPLLAAAKRNHETIVDVLSAHGARVDYQDYEGQTPLHWAVTHENVRMAELLLRRGANVDITNKQRLTPEALANRVSGEQGKKLQELLRNNRAGSSSADSLSSVSSTSSVSASTRIR